MTFVDLTLGVIFLVGIIAAGSYLHTKEELARPSKDDDDWDQTRWDR